MSEPDQIKLEDLTRGELIELVKRLGRPISQRTFVELKWQSAGKTTKRLGKKFLDLAVATDAAFDAWFAETNDRRRSVLHIKWIDVKKSCVAADVRYTAAHRAEERLWEKLQALDFEAGAV